MRTIFLLTFLFVITFSANATNIYFSNTGNDNNLGISPSSAWQTLNKLNFFRNLTAGDSVLFNRGDSFYGPISITQSGTSGRPIVFGAYGTGAKPVITGFTTLTSWTNLGGNVWESSDQIATVLTPNIVIINGAIATLGRYPNIGWSTIRSSTRTSITSALLGATDWTGAEVVIRKERWIIDRNKITSQSGSTIRFASGNSDPKNGWGYFIQNDNRTLDKQNEWYYNPSTKKLRVYSTVSPTNVQVSTTDTIINLVGKDYITFDNLSFQGANKNIFFIQVSKHITIQNSNLDFCGDEAIYGTWGGYDSDHIIIKNNSFSNNSNNSIQLISQQFSNAYIGYNTFKNIGMEPGAGSILGHQSTAISIEGPNSIVEYNTIDSIGYNGINYNGNNTIIQNNFITNICLLKDDGAGIYTGIGYGNPPATGQKVLNNIILNSIGNSSGTPDQNSQTSGNGIYMDDYTANVEIAGNTTANCSRGGILLHNASYINIHDNISYNNLSGQLVMQADSNTTRNNIFNRNTFFSKTATQPTSSFLSALNYISNFGTFDNNYYARPMDDSSTIEINNWATVTHKTLAQWKTTYGKDANSNKSPKIITDVNDIRFEYNATASTKKVTLNDNYINVAGTPYYNSVTLPPFTSIILVKNSGNGCPIPQPEIVSN